MGSWGKKSVVFMSAASLAGLLVAPESAKASTPVVTITPYTVPGSVFAGSLDSAPAAVRAAAVQGAVQGAPGTGVSLLTRTPAPLVAGAGAASVVSTVGVGCFIGFDGTTAVLRLTGLPAEDTGYRGLMKLVNGPIEVSEAYTADSDWTPSASTGWVPSNAIAIPGHSVVVGLSVNSDMAWGDHGQSPVVRIDNLGGELPSNRTFLEWYQSRVWSTTGNGHTAGATLGCANGSFSISRQNPGPWEVPGGMCSFEADGPYQNGYNGVEILSEAGQVLARYLPPGHALRPELETVPPFRAWEVRYRCSSAPGDTMIVRSRPFRDSDSSFPPMPDARCESGEVLSAKLWRTTLGNAALDRMLDTWERAGTWSQDFPQCKDGSCILELLRVDAASGELVSCMSDPVPCARWVQGPDRAEEYRCRYAGQIVPLTDCLVYGPAIDIAAGLVPLDENGNEVPNPLPPGDPVTGGAVPADSYSPSIAVQQVIDPIPPASIDQDYDVQLLADRLVARYKFHRPDAQQQLEDAGWAVPMARQCLYTAAAAGLDAWDECNGKPIFFSGRNVPEATDHDIEAMTGTIRNTDPNPEPIYKISDRPGYELTRTSSSSLPNQPPAAAYIRTSGSHFNPGWVVQSWEGGEATGKLNRGWYENHPDCVGKNLQIQCDEFPLFATEQGSKPGQPTPHLRLIPQSPNGSQGSTLGINRCKLERGQLPPDRRFANTYGGDQFLFVPMPKMESRASEVPWSGWICFEQREAEGTP